MAKQTCQTKDCSGHVERTGDPEIGISFVHFWGDCKKCGTEHRITYKLKFNRIQKS
jgi:hypothetical protein